MCICSGKAIVELLNGRRGRGRRVPAHSLTYLLTYRKERTMSNQPDQDKQLSETLTSEEVSQSILAEPKTSKQEIGELSDEQLMDIAGGSFFSHALNIGTSVCCTPMDVIGSGIGALGGSINAAVHHKNITQGAESGMQIGSFIGDPIKGGIKTVGKKAFSQPFKKL